MGIPTHRLQGSISHRDAAAEKPPVGSRGLSLHHFTDHHAVEEGSRLYQAFHLQPQFGQGFRQHVRRFIEIDEILKQTLADYNEENLIVAHDPGLVQAFSEVFERLWEQLA